MRAHIPRRLRADAQSPPWSGLSAHSQELPGQCAVGQEKAEKEGSLGGKATRNKRMKSSALNS